MTNCRPTEPLYLWAERPLVEPDREYTKDQRVHAVDNPSLTPFWPENESCRTGCGTSVLIFPGGGYRRLAMTNEGYDIAHWFNTLGITAFVVKYRLHEYGFPYPLLDGIRALRLVRKHAADWNLDPARIGVVGFSAGAHLAASAVLKPDFRVDDEDPLADIEARPSFAVLAYPLITLEGDDAHVGSRKALLGAHPDTQLIRDNSLQFQVTPDMPPMFIQQGIGDQTVPVASTLAFFAEVQKYNKHSELHVYQSDIHGVGMVQGQGSVSSWPDALKLWLLQNQWIVAG